MGLTSWAELYFRSLNPDKLLNQLTNYLLQYKRVSLPYVGTIRLVPQPPKLNVVDKLLLPPFYTAQLTDDDTIPEHQLRFLSRLRNEKKEMTLRELEKTGSLLSEKIDGDGFEWKGIGVIRRSQEPVSVYLTSLDKVTAEKVFRPDAEHNLLVGDKQKIYRQASSNPGEVAADLTEEETTEEGSRRSVFIIIGWIVLILSVLYILFVLYQGGFRINATGSRQSPVSYFQSESLR
jgi:hypothetical protein